MDLKPVHNWAESSITGQGRGPIASTQPQQSSSDVNHQQELGLRVGVQRSAFIRQWYRHHAGTEKSWTSYNTLNPESRIPGMMQCVECQMF